MFGETVKLTYKGKESFPTTIGSVLSMVILFMLASFSAYKMFILVTRNSPAVSQQSFLKDLDTEPPFLPYNDSLG
jgi:hypothetical protein